MFPRHFTRPFIPTLILSSCFVCAMSWAANVPLPSAFQIVKSYRTDHKNYQDQSVQNPYDALIDAQGRLLVLDRFSSKVHIWNADGSYALNLGSKRVGPGGFSFGTLLDRFDDKIYVWDRAFTMHVFDIKGSFLYRFRVPKMIRKFKVLSADRILIAYQDDVQRPTVFV